MNLFSDFKSFRKEIAFGGRGFVCLEVLADLETPVSAFLKVNGKGSGILLESVENGQSQSRYSFIGINPEKSLEYSSGVYKEIQAGKTVKKIRTGNPLNLIQKRVERNGIKHLKGRPGFMGGAVGYMSYESAGLFESLPKPKEPCSLPDIFYFLVEDLLIFDHLKRTITIACSLTANPKSDTVTLKKIYSKAKAKVEVYHNRLAQSLPDDAEMSPGSLSASISSTRSNFTKQQFCTAVKKAKEYIRKGDIIQVVLSQRFSRKLKTDDFSVYRQLRSLNPSPYMFYIRTEKFSIAGSSPETHVRRDADRVELKPIAGTRPRGDSESKDNALAADLLNDPKELAEHVMLVDLGRNDLGRVCRTGSVKVESFKIIERYSHVMHIVSKVSGRMRRESSTPELIAATFPAGTVSGAPKVRAMEIIHELEKDARGPYSGLVGYLSFSGSFDSCITIRTMIYKDGIAHIQAGAGIVADSVPESEWEETNNKAKAMMKAIDLAESLS